MTTTPTPTQLPPEGLYRRATPRGLRYWSIELDADTVHTASGSDPGKMRARSRTFADATLALVHADKTRLKKLREGFVFERPLEEADLGDIVVRVALPHAHPQDFFDVDPSARHLVVGSEKRPTNDDGWLHTVDLDTACVEEVLQASTLGRPRSQVRDAVGQRVLVFDTGDVLRVVDGQGESLWQTSVASPSAECRAGAIAPSGRRVAAYIASRHRIYGHADAADDTTNEVRVFDVDTDRQVATVALPWQARRVGLTPDDRTLVVLRDYNQGPAFFDLDSGQQTAAFDHHPWRDDRWQSCQTWAYSPDGARLALADHHVRLVDARSHDTVLELYSTRQGYERIQQLVFSYDGRVLFGGGTGGQIVGWKVA